MGPDRPCPLDRSAAGDQESGFEDLLIRLILRKLLRYPPSPPLRNRLSIITAMIDLGLVA